MARFQTPGPENARPENASLARRRLLIGGAALALSACTRASPLTAAHTPKLDVGLLNRAVGDIARRAAPARLGVGLMNLDSGETWAWTGEQPFPLAGAFVLPLAAAALAQVDAGQLSLDEAATLRDVDLSPPPSAIADAWPQRASYTLRELLAQAAARGDHTAADVLMARIGGPGAVTAWLVGKGVAEVRIDRYTRELEPESMGMAPFRPAWKGEAAYAAALRTVPPQHQLAAMRAYLADPRDTATPRGVLNLLDKLRSGDLLSPASRRLLLQILEGDVASPGRLRAGLPKGSRLAHVAGSARTILGLTPATNDLGIATLPDGRRYAMAVFLAASPLAEPKRDGLIAQVARALVRGVG